MNYVHINIYSPTPKHPLNKLPHLSPQLIEYHLRLMVKLIKEKKVASENKDFLSIDYEKKLKRRSRKAIMEKSYREEFQKKYYMTLCDIRKDTFIPQLNHFIKSDEISDTYLDYLRMEFLNSKND